MKNARRARNSSIAAIMKIRKIFGLLKESATHRPDDQISTDTLRRTWIFFHQILLKTIATIALAGMA